jgi:hypothetical protein
MIKTINCPKLILVLAVFSFSLFYIFSKQPAHALTVPTRLEIEGDPGQTLYHELEIYNEGDQEVTFYISSQNFEARGETGSPYFLPDTSTGLASWIFSAENVVVGPKERVKFPYEIRIPQDAKSGGYFASIFFGTIPPSPEGEEQVTLGSKTGTLVFLNISGDTLEKAGVIEFKTKGGNVFSYLPVTMYYRFSNDGERKIIPVGTIDIKCMFGRTISTLDANNSKGNVLPKSVRRFEIVWSKLNQNNVTEKGNIENNELIAENQDINIGFFEAVKMQKDNFAIGKYSAELNLKYGDNKTSTNQLVFWVIPWQILTLIIGTLILLITIARMIMKKHNRKLIEKVKKETLTSQLVNITPTETMAEKGKTAEEELKDNTEMSSENDEPQDINPVS